MTETLRNLPRRCARGFTLIELMIAVAIVAILASIAYPQYTSYIARAKRADARAQLMQAAQYMARYYAANDSFANDRSIPTVYNTLPAGLQNSPAEATGTSVNYQIVLPDKDSARKPTATTFIITATAVNSMAKDECSGYYITNTGVKGILVSGVETPTGALRDKCWK